MYRAAFFLYLCTTPIVVISSTIINNSIENNVTHSDNNPEIDMTKGSLETETEDTSPEDTPCTCGVFLSSQFKKGSKDQPKGEPVLTQEIDTPFMDNALGNKQCTHRCLEMIIKHLPKSSDIICATVDKEEVHREKAFLFVRNHSDKWHATNFSAGREFCCKDHEPYKCSKSPK